MDILERDGCLQELEAGLVDVLGGQGRVVLVSGEAGIGKTTLVQRFADNHESVRVLWGQCDAQFTPHPLGPLHDMAVQLEGPLPTLLAAGVDRSGVFSAVLNELSRQPTIAVFEDVHWADDATLDLLGFLGRRIGRTCALVVLTYRDDELGPRHPLRLLLGDLAGSKSSRRVALPPLSEAAVRVLVDERAVDAVELHRRTAGNPFFVTEILANPGIGLPPTVRDAVFARAARLSAAGQAVLQVAAVIGPRIEPWLLATLCGPEAPGVDECLARGMLVGQGQLLAFRHELARQAIAESIPPPQRIGLHARALDALRGRTTARRDAARLAHHAAGAADCQAILQYAPAAARDATMATAHREAATLYQLALGCTEGLAPSGRAALLEAYAAECNVIDQRAEAIAARHDAIAVWYATGDRRKQAENSARLVPMLLGIGQYAEAERCTREAVALLEPLPPGGELALAYRMQALVHLARREVLDAIRSGERAIELAERCGDDDVAAMSHVAVGSAWLLLDYDRGCAYMHERLARALETGREMHVGNVYAHLGRRAAELYRLHDAERALAEGIAYTDGRDLDTFSLYMLAWLALTLMHLGRWSEASAVGRRVALRSGMSAANRIPALVALGRLHARADFVDGQTALDEALSLAASIGTAETLGMVRAARAERAWLAGDRVRALEEACAGYDLAIRQQHVWVAGELAFWRWRAGDLSPALDWLAEPFVLQMAGRWQAAADAWCHLGCPYEQARALADGDDIARRAALEILQRLGARDASRRLSRELRAVGLGPVPRGPYATTRENPFGLTARQADVLALLGNGLSNAEIGARLSIAPKTVDHHVAAVLAKLQVHSRKAAVALARKPALTAEVPHLG